MATLKELMAKQSPESQARIAEKVEEMRQAIALSMLREELNMSQAELAKAMGVKQPTIAKMEQADNDPRLSTLKRYVAALGGNSVLMLSCQPVSESHSIFNPANLVSVGDAGEKVVKTLNSSHLKCYTARLPVFNHAGNL